MIGYLLQVYCIQLYTNVLFLPSVTCVESLFAYNFNGGGDGGVVCCGGGVVYIVSDEQSPTTAIRKSTEL